MQSHLRRAFLLQLLIISIATIAGIAAASAIAEKILVNRALQAEADFFWDMRAQDHAFPVPATVNLQGYNWQGDDNNIPDALSELPVGQHRVMLQGDGRIVHISEQNGNKLALLFQDETVSKLSFYFGTVPLALVLLFMYGMAFFAYSSSRRAVSPIAQLADTIENFDFDSRDANELELSALAGGQSSETRILGDALTHFVQRSTASVERERDFARYASHELRNPLAVIKGSATNLSISCDNDKCHRSVDRILRASNHMIDLISTLLLLAREQKTEEDCSPINVNNIADELIADFQEVLPKSSVNMRAKHNAQLDIIAAEPALRIVAGNVLRNAWQYTQNGLVECVINADSIQVIDTGPGVSKANQQRIFEPFFRVSNQAGASGHGLGLALAKKLCDNHGWLLSIDSELGSGTTVRIIFTNSVAGASDGM